MEFLFLIISLIIYGFKELDERSGQPSSRRVMKPSGYQKPCGNEAWYLERIFVLDAAENGVFVPGAEQVFEDYVGSFAADYDAYADDYDYSSSCNDDIDYREDYF